MENYMYKNQVYKSILDCSIDDNLLENFCKNISSQDFDKENSFEKYYSLEIIKLATNKVKDDERDALWLANWANAYSYILMASTWDGQSSDNQAKDYVINKISEALNSLSFFESGDDEKYYSILSYLKRFENLDNLYKMINEINTFYSLEKNNDYFEADILFVNTKQKLYYKIKSFDLLDTQNDDATLLSLDELNQKISQLQLDGYKEVNLE